MTRAARATTIALATVAAILLGGFHIPRVSVSPRILLIYDMEGASGVLSGETMNPGRPDSFAVGRTSLIDDVNAVIVGLFDGGALGVDVINSHGAGGDTLVPPGRLDGRARIVSLSSPRLVYESTSGLPDSGYHAVVVVAMHDKPLSGGFSPHTMGAGLTPVINGSALTESELVGYAFGTRDIPVIFASGDDRLKQSLGAAMPWVEYVVVKQVTSPTVVAARPPEVVRQALRAGAARATRALAQHGVMRPMRLVSPIRAGLLATYPAWLPPGLATLPGVQRSGDTVTFLAPDYEAAMRGIRFFVNQGSRNFARLTVEYLRSKSQWQGALQEARDSIWARAGAFERGEWKP